MVPHWLDPSYGRSIAAESHISLTKRPLAPSNPSHTTGSSALTIAARISCCKKIQSFLKNVSTETLSGPTVACFDICLLWPRWMSGTAVRVIDKKLRKLRAQPVHPPKRCFVKGGHGTLQSGEVDRTAQWAR
jgi:hypothetical protein